MRRLILAVCVGGASIHAAAWGTQGHQIVAELAVATLSPQARDEVNDLLGGATLSSIASYADEVRNNRPERFEHSVRDRAFSR